MTESSWPRDRRITVRDLQAATDRGERWAMLTSYDALTAGVFERAGVRALLVGDTAAMVVMAMTAPFRSPWASSSRWCRPWSAAPGAR